MLDLGTSPSYRALGVGPLHEGERVSSVSFCRHSTNLVMATTTHPDGKLDVYDNRQR